MTIEQMKAALEIERAGSISKAAENLFLSQSRLSKSIHVMEKELGYELFYRHSGGIIPTAKGAKFLDYSRNILHEYAKIQELAHDRKVCHFHLACSNFYYFIDAYVRFVYDHQHDDVTDIRMENLGIAETLDTVQKGKNSMGMILARPDDMDHLEGYAAKHNLVLKEQCRIGSNITLRKDHPALINGQLDYDILRRCPMVDYARKETDAILKGDVNGLINPDRLILIEERHVKHQIISQTDAFGIGVELSREILDANGLTAVPLNSDEFSVISVMRGRKDMTDEERCYLHHLQDIIQEYGKPLLARRL